MAITVASAFKEEYTSQVIHLSQQGDARLRPHVKEVPLMGESYNFEILASVDMAAKGGRRVATAYTDDTWTRRVAQSVPYVNTMTIESEDKLKTLCDPESAYAKAQGMAVKRQYDDLIIAAATGTALDGDGATPAFPAGQKVGDGTAAISFDYVTQVQEKFLGNEIDMDVPKVFVVGPTQVRQLMQLTQATSADYVTTQSLQQLNATGIVPMWMGFTWIMSNRLLAPGVGEISCLAFTKDAIGLAVTQDLMVRIGEDPAHSYMNQVFVQMTAGAVRIEDAQIVHAHFLDS